MTGTAGPTAPPCPRCGRSAPAAGPFCPYCGRYLTALEWVAVPPPPETLPEAARPRPAPARRPRYQGPPRYREIPRWGLPPGPWPDGGSAGPPASAPLRRARATATYLVPSLLVTAMVAAIATAAEVWRYVLLLFSRTEALSASAVGWSDSLVWFGGLMSLIGVVVCGILMIWWSRVAALAAAERSGTSPSRSGRMIVAGWLVPGVNLAVPGAVLSEIEHAALGLPADRRPTPSTGLRIWWVAWAASVVLSVVTALWSLRTGTQALADGVVLHAWLDALAVVTALLTRREVVRLTGLLEPSDGGRRELLVGAAAPG